MILVQVILSTLIHLGSASIFALLYNFTSPSLRNLAILAAWSSVWSFITVVWIKQLKSSPDSILTCWFSLAFVELLLTSVFAFLNHVALPALNYLAVFTSTALSFSFVAVIRIF